MNPCVIAWVIRVVLAVLAAVVVPAHAQSSAYHFTAPTDWTRTDQGALTIFVPAEDPSGAARLLLFPVQPKQADFAVQFAAARAMFEQIAGWRNPQAVPVQRGRSKNGEYVAYGASYMSNDGARYVLLFALANKGAFGMMAFIANSNAAYTRYAPYTTASFNTLQLTDEAARLARENLNATSKYAHSPTNASSAPDQGSTGSSVETTDTVPSGVTRSAADNGERVPKSGLMNGKPQGLFIGFSALSGNPVFLLFLDHGRIFNRLPLGGLNKIDWSSLAKDFPNSIGEWSVTDRKLTLKWSGGGVWEDMITPTPKGMRFNGKNYYSASYVDLTQFWGKYEGRQSTAWLNSGGVGPSLTRATTIVLDGKGGFSFDSAVGGDTGNAAVYRSTASSGTVMIEGYDAVFKHQDGHSERQSIIRFPDDDSFVLNGTYYIKSK